MEFPNEIWRQILINLDTEQLKQCLLVSRDFREMIIKTPQLMKKLQLIFFNENWQSKLPFIEKYGYYVRSIKFDDCGFRAMQDLKKILTLTPNVETLIFYNCFILEPHVDYPILEDGDGAVNNNHPNDEALEMPIAQLQMPLIGPEMPPAQLEFPPLELPQPAEAEGGDQIETESVQVPDDPDDDDPIELKRLTFLHLDSCNIAEKLVHSLRNCNTLKSFKITFYYQAPVDFFTDFLCQQDKLEELTCVGWSDMVFKSLFKDDISQERIKFKLKKFTLECELSYHANFSKFMRAQARHIKELELTCYNINFHYYRLLFNHFQSLKKLTLPTDWFLTDDRANEIKNCRIPSLKELELVGSNDDIATFKSVIEIFPNIEVLRAENVMYFSLHGILEKFTKLRHIKAENFRVETLLFVKLPSLKVIETSYLYPMSLSFLWENLSENCANIEQIIIKDIGHFKLNESIKKEIRIIISNLAKFKKLKYCEIVSSPQDPMVNGDEDQNDVQLLPHDHPFYKVIIDNTSESKRAIKISQYFAQNCVDDVNLLKETFSKFEVIEL